MALGNGTVRLILSHTNTHKRAPPLCYKDIFCHKNMVGKKIGVLTQKFIIDFDVSEQINPVSGRSFHLNFSFPVAVTQFIVIYNLVKVTQITRG